MGRPSREDFEELQRALATASVLQFPNYEKTLTLYTDASLAGLGAILMQPDHRGKLGSIAYASRSFNRAQGNYSVTHLEGLAIVWALKNVSQPDLWLSVNRFHRLLTGDFSFQGQALDGPPRSLGSYYTRKSSEIKYVPGRANTVADALFRNIGAVNADSTPVENFSLQQLAAQGDHAVWKTVIYVLERGDETSLSPLSVPFSQFSLSPDRVLCRYWPSKRHPVEQYVMHEPLTPTVLHLAHDAVVAGHLGWERTLAALLTHYYRPTMKIDIEKHVDQCAKCAIYKGVTTGPAPIQQYPPPTRPFECVSVDLLQLPPSYQGSKYIEVMVDMFSRFVILEPIAKKTARAVAHAIVSRLIFEHTAPIFIGCSWVTTVLSLEIKSFMKFAVSLTSLRLLQLRTTRPVMAWWKAQIARFFKRYARSWAVSLALGKTGYRKSRLR